MRGGSPTCHCIHKPSAPDPVRTVTGFGRNVDGPYAIQEKVTAMHRSALLFRGNKLRITALAAAVIFLTSACGQQGADQAKESPHNDEAPHSEGSSAAGENPFGHVHGLAFDEATEQLLLATHNGLFDVAADPIKKISPTIDLMGFAVAGEDLYYASGHPGPGSDLPNPVGLIESTDGGQTWQELSRQGESDFHAMAVSDEGVIGFDGTLRLSPDGEEWFEVDAQIGPANLAAFPDGPIVLATTEEGIQRSTDGGLTWALVNNSPVLLLTAFANAEIAVGIAPDGTVHLSSDAGQSWKTTGGSTDPASAITASMDEENGLRIWVATEKGIEFSDDDGASFSTTVKAGH